MLIVILIRLLVPLTILKDPLFGGLASLLVDYLDLDIVRLISAGSFPDYQAWDKALDLYYLSFEAWIVLSWQGRRAKIIALSFFLYRVIGTVVFEVTGMGIFLVIFPNFFEIFFLLYLIYQKFLQRQNKVTFQHQATFYVLLLVLFAYKVYQEYFLHVSTIRPWPGSEWLGLR